MTATALQSSERRSQLADGPLSRARSAEILGQQLPLADARRGGSGSGAPPWRSGVLVRRRLAGVPRIRRRLPVFGRLESPEGKIRRCDRDLWHARHIFDCDADCRSSRTRHCGFSDGTLLAAAAPADRDRNRAPRGDSVHHLRHLGRLLFSAGDAELYPAVPHQLRSATFPALAFSSRGRRSATAC